MSEKTSFRAFRAMVPKRMGGHEITFVPAYKAQSRRCRASWTDTYGRLDVSMQRKDWQALRSLEAAAVAHVSGLSFAADATPHTYVLLDDEGDEEADAVVRLKVTARTEVFDSDGQPQDGMPPAGTAMDVRVLVESNKVWLREGRFGLELRLAQVKWYPRPLDQQQPHRQKASSVVAFLEDPDE